MTTEQERKKNRERQQRLRDRKKYDRQESEYADQMNREGLAHRIREGRCFLGEVSPGVDATDLTDALRLCRIWLRVLGQSDIQPGESLLTAERRMWNAWIAADAPFLTLPDQRLVRGWSAEYFLSFGGFEKSWLPLPGSDQPITESLPPLSVAIGDK